MAEETKEEDILNWHKLLDCQIHKYELQEINCRVTYCKNYRDMSKYWILKSEPYEFSIHDLEAATTSIWDGIRNYQARNYIREMNLDDIAFFYHSNCKVPGIYGRMKVSATSYADPTAVDKTSKYYDTRAIVSNPWLSVDVSFLDSYNEPLTLNRLKELPLGNCPLTKKGNRLSVIPLTDEQYELIIREINTLNDL